jgi:hypothetical protein
MGDSKYCITHAEQYGGIKKVAICRMVGKTANYADNRLVVSAQEPVLGKEFKGRHTISECYLEASSPEGVVTLYSLFHSSTWLAVERKTGQILASWS